MGQQGPGALFGCDKINEHCVSMQGSGAKLWFLRNQGFFLYTSGLC